MLEELKGILTAQAGLPSAPITADATLADAGIDSMAVTVLSMQLEDRMGLFLTEDELACAPTVNALADLIASRAAGNA
ncbi:acyl carrier protein [Streptomyces sp. NPDC020707]|uniref:Acyl carrier protein n=1 Tax=Streptomyces ortus TaxID=2867268 RepID=A0ABT3VJ95_9ACTN|nr:MULTISPECIES: acyl carrier protein [Streptomyces]MCX4238576.1 acyl carrier protein [Streptomyces ortus]